MDLVGLSIWRKTEKTSRSCSVELLETIGFKRSLTVEHVVAGHLLLFSHPFIVVGEHSRKRIIIHTVDFRMNNGAQRSNIG